MNSLLLLSEVNAQWGSQVHIDFIFKKIQGSTIKGGEFLDYLNDY